MRVFVLDKNKQPLMPCKPARARKLLSNGKAAVFLRFPFTIILKEREGGNTQPISLNVDPGSKTTGLAINAKFDSGNTCVAGIHIEHRGYQIKSSLDSRRAIRRSRRQRKTRYRAPRFLNRKKPNGWLPPSLMSRVHNLETWSRRLIKLAPITSANVETIRFDMQLIENPDIQGKEYQQGSLADWEVREYLFYRHNHTCAYCNGLSKDSLLEKEHFIPKKLFGSNRLSNLFVSCRTCNEIKGSKHPEVWLKECLRSQSAINKQRAKAIQAILEGYRPSLRDAAAVNATRYATGRVIKSVIKNTQFWSGGRTKKNRSQHNYAKDHWIDAACLGTQGESVILENNNVLLVSAKGHGSRQMCRVDRYGFPRTSAKASRTVQGFRTGDIVKAEVPKGKKQGFHTGRVAVRSSGSFNITTADRTVQGIGHKYCTLLQRGDGYNYQTQKIANTLKGECEKQAA